MQIGDAAGQLRDLAVQCARDGEVVLNVEPILLLGNDPLQALDAIRNTPANVLPLQEQVRTLRRGETVPINVEQRQRNTETFIIYELEFHRLTPPDKCSCLLIYHEPGSSAKTLSLLDGKKKNSRGYFSLCSRRPPLYTRGHSLFTCSQ